MLHPVIFLSTTNSGIAEVATCPTQPHPEKFGKDVYVRVAKELTMTNNIAGVFLKDILCVFELE